VLCEDLPDEIKRILSEDKSRQPWRETVLDLAIENLRTAKRILAHVEPLNPRIDRIGSHVIEIHEHVVHGRQRDAREQPSNLFGPSERSRPFGRSS
jgi:hypothetical protein